MSTVKRQKKIIYLYMPICIPHCLKTDKIKWKYVIKSLKKVNEHKLGKSISMLAQNLPEYKYMKWEIKMALSDAEKTELSKIPWREQI